MDEHKEWLGLLKHAYGICLLYRKDLIHTLDKYTTVYVYMPLVPVIHTEGGYTPEFK